MMIKNRLVFNKQNNGLIKRHLPFYGNYLHVIVSHSMRLNNLHNETIKKATTFFVYITITLFHIIKLIIVCNSITTTNFKYNAFHYSHIYQTIFNKTSILTHILIIYFLLCCYLFYIFIHRQLSKKLLPKKFKTFIMWFSIEAKPIRKFKGNVKLFKNINLFGGLYEFFIIFIKQINHTLISFKTIEILLQKLHVHKLEII